MAPPARTRDLRWLFAMALVAVACGGAPARDAPRVHNEAPACKAVYEAKPGPAPAMLVVDARVVWIDEGLDEINSVPVTGGDVASFRSQEPLGSIYGVVAVGTNLFAADASHDSIRLISLADRTVRPLVGNIRHPYELAYAAGMLFIGGEDELYRYDVAREQLTELGRNTATRLAAFGDVVYAALEDRKLVAIDASTGDQRGLVESLEAVDGSAFEPAGFAATARGPVWSTALGAIWMYDVATRRSRKLVQLEHPALQILTVDGDLYFAAGAGVQRLRDDRLEAIPIDKTRWDDDPRIRITQIGVHADTLIYHAPFTAFASVCLDRASPPSRHRHPVD